MASGWAQGAEKLCGGVDFSFRREYGVSGARNGRLGRGCQHIGDPCTAKESTGVGAKCHKPVGQTLGQFVETLAPAADVAADLLMIEKQRQRVSQKSNHCQHHQSRALVDCGVFEMAVGRQGLKH